LLIPAGTRPMMRLITLAALAGLVGMEVGCVSRPTSMIGSYPGGSTAAPPQPVQVVKAPTVEYGRVIEVRPVMVEGQAGNLGVYGGGVAGAIATNPNSMGTGDLVGAAIGGVVGSAIGGNLQKLAARQSGQQIFIQLDNGDAVTVIQHARDGYYEEGDRVRVMDGPQGAYVSMETDPDGAPEQEAGTLPLYEQPGVGDPNLD